MWLGCILWLNLMSFLAPQGLDFVKYTLNKQRFFWSHVTPILCAIYIRVFSLNLLIYVHNQFGRKKLCFSILETIQIAEKVHFWCKLKGKTISTLMSKMKTWISPNLGTTEQIATMFGRIQYTCNKVFLVALKKQSHQSNFKIWL